MLRRSKIIIPITLLAFLISAMIAYLWQSTQNQKTELSSQDQQSFKRDLQIISNIWRNGDIWNSLSSNTECADIYDQAQYYGDHILQCNPEVLKCLSGHSLLEHLKIRVKGPVHYHDFPEVFDRGLRVTVSNGIKSGNLILPWSCHQMALPQRLYPINASRADEREGWDSFQAEVFVDQYLVRFVDLKVWAELSLDENLKEKVNSLKEGHSPYAVATGLNAGEMHSYCAFYGSEVLSSQVLDAMSFFPRDISNPRPDRFRLPPYPWSARERDSFLYDIRFGERGELEAPYDMTQEECLKVFTSECLEEFSKYKHSPLSPTWSGIFQVLGGFPEYVVNPLRPRDNLRASSFYFSAKSPWHRVGQRAYWDGVGFGLRNFNWRLEYPDEKFDSFKIGFRCMKRRR